MDDLQRYAVEHRRLGGGAAGSRSRTSFRAAARVPPRASSVTVGTGSAGRAYTTPAPGVAAARSASRNPRPRCSAGPNESPRNAEAPVWKAAAATASAGTHLADGCSASMPAPRAVRSATSRSPCRVATSVSDGSTKATSPSAGRYQAASTRWRFACRTAATDAAWCEKTVQPRTLACAMPARSSAFVSAWRTIATAVRPDGSSTATARRHR